MNKNDMIRYDEKYFLLIKTGDAEIRALENFWEDNESILPIFELTRGRRSSIDKIGHIEKRIEKLKNIFNQRDICLDLTTSQSLSNSEIDKLYKPAGGYKEWINLLIELKSDKVFRTIIPTIIIEATDKNLSKNLETQVKAICENFSDVCYRSNLKDDGYLDDIDAIKEIVLESGINFIFIFDCEYITAASWSDYATRISGRINIIKKKLPDAKFILTSTSFPKYVGDIGDDDADSFHIFEIDLFNRLQALHKEIELYYGDYGSINPERNDDIIMSRGWRPRIDVPLTNEIFYYRLKRNKRDYSDVYAELASDYVIKDPRFPYKIKNNWGIEQINLCAAGLNPGSSPSFWISVRMNIHIHQQLKRLRLL